MLILNFFIVFVAKFIFFICKSGFTVIAVCGEKERKIGFGFS